MEATRWVGSVCVCVCVCVPQARTAVSPADMFAAIRLAMWLVCETVFVSSSDLESTAWSRVKYPRYHADSRSKFIKTTDSNIVIRYLVDLKSGTRYSTLGRYRSPLGSRMSRMVRTRSRARVTLVDRWTLPSHGSIP